ncbi:MAG: hypothetical protein CMC08_00895 [Flavobacteriaceae bacterium]|nr:hypothetical protein [Flavobacteriaceae bacterium]
MNYFLRAGAYLFHPLLMPLLGVVSYYMVSPRFADPNIVAAKLLAIGILTFIVPIILFFLLKSLGAVDSIHLNTVRERRIPLMLQCLLLLLIVKLVFDPYDETELYYFFVGILFSALSALILGIFKFKASLHQMGIAGVTMFLIGLSIHFEVNVLIGLSFFFIVNGWVASSRLHTESHVGSELVVGFFLGMLPQLIMFNFYL